jgi:hypothetical protein
MALNWKGIPIANYISPIKHPYDINPINTLFLCYCGNNVGFDIRCLSAEEYFLGNGSN